LGTPSSPNAFLTLASPEIVSPSLGRLRPMPPELTDTSPEIAALQRQRLAAMSLAERGRLMSELCQTVTDVAIAGIRREHPDATEAEVRSHLLLRRYGADFVALLPPEVR